MSEVPSLCLFYLSVWTQENLRRWSLEPGILCYCSFVVDLLLHAKKMPTPTWHRSKWENLQECNETVNLWFYLDATQLWTSFFSSLNSTIEMEMALSGNLNVFEKMYQNGIHPDAMVGFYAAKGGNLPLLEWGQNRDLPGFRYTASLLCACCSGGQVNLYKHLLQSSHTLGQFMEMPSVEESFLCEAGLSGSIEMVAYLLDERHFAWFPLVAANAAYAGHFRLLKWLHSGGHRFDARTFRSAAGRACATGDLITLEWLWTISCPFDAEACASAVRITANELKRRQQPLETPLIVLKWLRDHNLPWNHECTEAAAEYGNLPCLQYALDHGCPVTDRALVMAKLNHYSEVVDYLSKSCNRNIYPKIFIRNCHGNSTYP